VVLPPLRARSCSTREQQRIEPTQIYPPRMGDYRPTVKPLLRDAPLGGGLIPSWGWSGRLTVPQVGRAQARPPHAGAFRQEVARTMTPSTKSGATSDAKAGNRHVVARAALNRSVKAAIRLRHSLAADRELAERLPAILEQYDAAVLAGVEFEYDIGELLDPPKSKVVAKALAKPKASPIRKRSVKR
jgi:hypothetical protein